MNRAWSAFLFLVLTLPAGARAEPSTASVDMSADRHELAVGEVLRLRVRAELTNLPDAQLELPTLDGFRIVGRSVSRPSQIQFFGGRTQIVSTSEVQELTLQAIAPGTHRIAPARVRSGRRTYESRPLTIVVRGSPGGGGATTDPPEGSAEDDSPTVEGGQFDGTAFLRTIVDKSEPYVGEQVTVTIYLYVRNALRSAPVIAREAATDGFWVHDLLPVSRTLESTQQIVRGTPFRVYVLRRFAAFPLRPGELSIGAAKVRLETGSVFDLFGGGRGGSIVRDGEPVVVKARALPGNRGTSLVGTFSAKAELDREEVATGDAVTYRVRVEGEGNLHDLELRLPDVPGLRILAPRVIDDIRPVGDRMGGMRSFEWLIIPERPGTYTLPALSFDRFDPASARFESVHLPPRSIAAVGRAVDVPVTEGESPRDEGPRFGPVRTRSAFLRARPPLSDAPWYPWALALPPLAWLGFVTVGASRARLRRRQEREGPKRVFKAVHARLAAAEQIAGRRDASAFYAEVAAALTETLVARLGGPIGGFTHAELRRHLLARGMDDDLARRIVDELEGCDFARFSASGVDPEEMSDCLSRVRALVERLARFEPRSEEVSA